MNMIEVISHLSSRRRVFHSEADFQHELAWAIKESEPKYSIRLEKPFQLNEKIFVDIYFENNSKFAIELKYKTHKGNFNLDNEEYTLRTHAATNLGRYDYLRDIERLENLKKKGLIDIGFAIFLTNASSYWDKLSKSSTLSKDFYISQDEVISNKELSWLVVNENSIGKKRTKSIQLSGNYEMNWINYSKINNVDFKILISQI